MWLKHEVVHSPLSSPEVKNAWSFTFIPLILTQTKNKQKVTKHGYRRS
jgi:hypothetical protein